MDKTFKISRRLFLRNGLFFAGGILFFSVDGPVLSAAEPITYDQLMLTLYPKTEGEKKYLREIVALVRKKKISEKVVYAAWRYAEKKKKTNRIRYFAEALTILSKRSGTKLTVKLKS